MKYQYLVLLQHIDVREVYTAKRSIYSSRSISSVCVCMYVCMYAYIDIETRFIDTGIASRLSHLHQMYTTEIEKQAGKVIVVVVFVLVVICNCNSSSSSSSSNICSSSSYV